MTPLDVVHRYVELFNAGQHAEMGALFAEESVWRRPGSPEVRGGAAIRAGYGSAEHAERAANLQASIVRCIVDGSTVAAQLSFRTPEAEHVVMDVFDVDENGKITDMTAYSR